MEIDNSPMSREKGFVDEAKSPGSFRDAFYAEISRGCSLCATVLENVKQFFRSERPGVFGTVREQPALSVSGTMFQVSR